MKRVVGEINAGGIHLTLVDGFLILLSMLLLLETIQCGADNRIKPFVHIEPLFIVYWLSRMLFSINKKLTSCLLFLFLTAFCMRELYTAYYQLFCGLGSKKAQEVCVGSFSNSGPLGCFLSICSILFVVVGTKTHNFIIRKMMIVMSFASFFLMVCTLSRAALFSFTVSLFFLALKKKEVQVFVKRFWVYIILAVILAGTGAYAVKKPSADGRLLMARVCWRMIKNAGLKGIGIGNFEGAYGEAQADFFLRYNSSNADLTDLEKIPMNTRMVADSPAYAFNDYLQIWIECGPIVLILLICIIFSGIVASYKNGNCWCYPLISISCFSLFSYPFEVNILLLLFVVFLSSNCLEIEIVGNNSLFYSFMIVALVCIYANHSDEMNKQVSSFFPVHFDKLCANRESKYYITKNSVQNGLYEKHILFTYGKALNAKKDYEKSDSVLVIGTHISSDPMFWNVMGNNSLAQGKYREAEERYKHAFYMVPNRLYPLCLLAKLYDIEGDTARFLKMADMIETFKPKIESVNTEFLRSEIRTIRTSYQ